MSPAVRAAAAARFLADLARLLVEAERTRAVFGRTFRKNILASFARLEAEFARI